MSKQNQETPGERPGARHVDAHIKIGEISTGYVFKNLRKRTYVMAPWDAHKMLQRLAEEMLEVKKPATSPAETSKIERVPGWKIYGVLQVLLTKKFVECHLAPVFADFQYEYIEAIREGDTRRAKWLKIIFHFQIVQVLLMLIAGCGGLIVKLWNYVKTLAE